MKKLLLLLSLSILSERLIPQPFSNRVFHSFNDHSGKLLAIQGNYYFNAMVTTPGFVDSSFIYSVSNSGKMRFRKLIIKNEVTPISAVIETLDHKLALIGHGDGCDFQDSNAKTFLIKMDTNGTIIFDNSFQIGANNFLTAFVQYPDSSFFAVAADSMFHFSKSGSLINIKALGFSAGGTMILLNNSHFLLSKFSGGAFSHVEIDTSGAIVNQGSSPFAVIKYKQIGSGAVICQLTDNTIRRLSPGLMETDSFTFPPNATLVDFATHQNAVHCVGTYSSSFTSSISTMFYTKLDTTLNLLSHFNNSSRIMRATSVYAGASANTALLSDCRSGNYMVIGGGNFTGAYTGITTISASGIFTYPYDIGVSALSLDTGFVTLQYGNILKGKYRFKIAVKNYTSDTIRSFYLNANITAPTICGADYFHQYFSNVVLQPLGTITLTTPFIDHYYASSILNGTVQPTYTISNLCFYTTGPNNQFDGNNSNDASCFSIEVPLILGVGNNILQSASIEIYPSPADEILNVKSTFKIKNMIISDLLGKQVTASGGDGNTGKIDTSQLPKGIYILAVETERGSFTRKVIKQ
jgi:hypothetical protein